MVMRNPINKRIFRLLLKKPASYFPIFIVSLIFVTFTSSFFLAQNSVEPLYYKGLEEGKVEDGNFIMDRKLTSYEIKDLQEENVKIYPSFYKEISYSYKGKDNQEAILRVYQNRKQINLTYFNDGREPRMPGEIAISANAGLVNKLAIGDFLDISNKKFKLVGFFASPDYSTVLKNQSDMVMDTKHFSLALMTKEDFDSFEKIKTTYQYSYHSESKLKEDDSMDKLENIMTRASKYGLVLGGVDFYNNRCIQYFIDDMGGDVPMMTIVMVIVFIALGFMTTIQSKSLVEDESAVIGSLLASGYTSKSLIFHYTLVPVCLVSLAAVVGNIISYLIGYKIYANLYYESYNIIKFVPIFSLKSFFVTSLVPVLIVSILNLLVLSRYFRLSPLRFLRKDLKKKSKNTRFKLKNTAFKKAFKIRVFLDNWVNIAALLFGVFVANLLIVYGISMKPIIKNYVEQMKTEMKYKNISVLKAPMDVLPEEMKGKIIDLKFKLPDEKIDDNKKLEIYGLDKGSRYNEKGLDDLKDKEVIISNAFAKKYKLSLGDHFFIKKPHSDTYKEVEVKEIFDDIYSMKVFMPLANLNKILEKAPDDFNVYFSDRSLDLPENLLLTEINQKKTGDYLNNFINNFDGVFKSILVVAFVFYIVLVFTVSKLILEKSRLNISYLKIFGYKDDEITKIYMRGIIFALLLFEIISLPIFDKLMVYMLILALSKIDFYIVAEIPKTAYIYMILAGVLIFIIVQFLQRRKISRLNMVEELKNING